MKSDKRQVYFMVGIVLLVMGGVFVCIGLSQSNIYDGNSSQKAFVSNNIQASSQTNDTALHSDLVSKQNTSTNVIVNANANANANANEMSETQVNNNNKQAVTVAPSSSQTTLVVNYPINLNTATAEQLMTIDGIGEKRAKAIIEYRNKIGHYDSVEQIMEVNGIGESIYVNVGGYLTV